MRIKIFIIFLLTTTVFSQNPTNPTSSSEDENIGSWEIENGILIENETNENFLALYNWNVFYSIFPKKITQKYIKRLVFFTDGRDEKTGALGALL